VDETECMAIERAWTTDGFLGASLNAYDTYEDYGPGNSLSLRSRTYGQTIELFPAQSRGRFRRRGRTTAQGIVIALAVLLVSAALFIVLGYLCV